MNIIYGLVDPRISIVRYIGKSTSGMKRPRNHMLVSKLKRDHTHKANWIRELMDLGLIYEIVILECVTTVGLLDEAERRWIAHGRSRGWPLTNLTEGGDGQTSPMPASTRAKIREARARQAPFSAETLAKMSKSRKGKPPGNAGKPASAEARAKMSAAHKGRVFSAETRAKIAATKLGKARPDVIERMRTPEARAQLAKIQEMGRGRPRPDLAERNRARAGRKVSEETRARMRAAHAKPPCA